MYIVNLRSENEIRLIFLNKNGAVTYTYILFAVWNRTKDPAWCCHLLLIINIIIIHVIPLIFVYFIGSYMIIYLWWIRNYTQERNGKILQGLNWLIIIIPIHNNKILFSLLYPPRMFFINRCIIDMLRRYGNARNTF